MQQFDNRAEPDEPLRIRVAECGARGQQSRPEAFAGPPNEPQGRRADGGRKTPREFREPTRDPVRVTGETVGVRRKRRADLMPGG